MATDTMIYFWNNIVSQVGHTFDANWTLLALIIGGMFAIMCSFLIAYGLIRAIKELKR